MRCDHCLSFNRTATAGQTPGDRNPVYGYCRAAETPEQKAKFFRGRETCWLTPTKFQEKK